jgi:RNA-binding protein YhbY
MKTINKLQLGKNGLTDAFIEQVRKSFDNARVLKINILKSACRDKNEAEEIGRKLIDLLGKKFNYKLVGYVLTIVKFRKEQR